MLSGQTQRPLDDALIVSALLSRDPKITRHFLYRQCYPLFKALFDKYYTDCDTLTEFINQLYLFIMVPRPGTGKSKLEQFGFKCSLTMWLKVVGENYCRQLFARRGEFLQESLDADDRKPVATESLIETAASAAESGDLAKVLDAMPNGRYRRLIELRYVDELSNEETAGKLGLTMTNYYNVHKRAKEQFCNCLRKEGLI